MRIDNDPKLDFDDVLIRPKRSEAPSRSAIILERDHRFLNSGASWNGVPIIASNMDTVGTMAMAQAMGPEMMVCLHKYYSEGELADFFESGQQRASTFFTMGISEDEFKKLLGVPQDKRLMTLIPIGVPVEWPTIEKKSLDEVIHWERYKSENQP